MSDKLSIIEIINIQIEKIKESNTEKEELITEIAILKSFLIHQNLFPELEEFRNMVFMEFENYSK